MKLKTVAAIGLATGMMFVGSLCQTATGWLGKAPGSAIAWADSGVEGKDNEKNEQAPQGAGVSSGSGSGGSNSSSGSGSSSGQSSSPKNYIKVEPNKK